MSGCNRVVSQCEMAGASVTIPHRNRPNNAPTAGPFGSGGARLGLSQKDGLPTRCWHVIDCGSRPSTRAKRGSSVAAPLTLVRAADWCVKTCAIATWRANALPYRLSSCSAIWRHFFATSRICSLINESRVCSASSSHSRALARYSSALVVTAHRPVRPVDDERERQKSVPNEDGSKPHEKKPRRSGAGGDRYARCSGATAATI
jgi:hypothetical protein